MLDETRSTETTSGFWAAAISVMLVASALVFVGFRGALGLGAADADPYESPLMLSVARQLVHGPSGLYGPFGRLNPLVLIHAPLYYRVACLLAWPLALGGLHPVDAARIAGRTISFAGLIATAMAAARLARLGGLPRRAGMWAAVLLVSSPVLAGFPFAVRPDLAGVALQTWAVALAAGAHSSSGLVGSRDRKLVAASVLFGLAACVKQHLVVAWAVTSAWAFAGWFSRRTSPAPLVRLIVPGIVVLGLIYGTEGQATGGRVWGAAFLTASQVGQVHPGDWLHVATVFAAMVGKGAGLGAMALAGILAARRQTRAGYSALSIALISTIAVTACLQLFRTSPWIAATLTIATAAALIVAATGWIASSRPSRPDERIDGLLLTLLAAELAGLIVLCRMSSGAWINYGFPPLVWISILTARSLARGTIAPSGLGRSIAAVAATAVLASALMDAKVELERRKLERDDVGRMFAATGLPPMAYDFADRPGLNRMIGRLDLVYDDWLYPAFERSNRAEPRSRWLRRFLESPGSVGAIVLESDRPDIDGVPVPLAALGFEPAGRFGAFRVWRRVRRPGSP